MSAIDAVAVSPSAGAAAKERSFTDLDPASFLQLLITQITQQDPLQPTSNEDLLKQLATIRDIEASTSIVDSLQKLQTQQRLGAVTSLIGRHVRSREDLQGGPIEGRVAAVSFDGRGSAQLQLENGATLAFEDVATVETPLVAAQRLVGQTVVANVREGEAVAQVQERVTGAREDGQGGIILTLESGREVSAQDVLALGDVVNEPAV